MNRFGDLLVEVGTQITDDTGDPLVEWAEG